MVLLLNACRYRIEVLGLEDVVSCRGGSPIYGVAVTDRLPVMTGVPLDPPRRAKAVRYLLLGWKPDAVAREVHCHRATIYRIEASLYTWGSAIKPHFRLKGQPRKLPPANEEALIQYLVRFPTAVQSEMVWFIWEECGVHVDQSRVSQLLKKKQWSKKKAERVAGIFAASTPKGDQDEPN